MATRSLVRWLQIAYSGELGAALAYRGHARSVARPAEKAEIFRIESEELDHRERVGRMLDQLGAAPDPALEFMMGRIGRFVSAFCRVGGWFLPMYGAGLIERRNIDEYVATIAAAEREGHPEFVQDLLDMADVEREHERYFRLKAASHRLWRFFPKWSLPPGNDNRQLTIDYSADGVEAGLESSMVNRQ